MCADQTPKLSMSPNMAAPVAAAAPGLRIVVSLGAVVFLTMVPVTMLVPVLKEVVADRFAASTFWTHGFMSINMVGAILGAPLGGVLADRLGRRKPILVVALVSDALLLLAMTAAPGLAVLLALRFLEGMAHIVALTSCMAMASDWAAPRTRGRMLGLVGACMMLGTSIGAPLGGAIGRQAPQVVFAGGAIISLLAAAVAMCVVQDGQNLRSRATLVQLRRLLRDHGALLVPYAYTFIDRFCVGVIITTFMLYLSNILSLAADQRGMMMAYFMLPFALLCYPVGRLVDRFERVWLLATGSFAFGLVLASYGFLPPRWLPAAMVASGVLSAVMFTPSLALCAELAPKDHRATAFAGFNAAGSLGFLCGPVLAGLLCTLMLPALGEGPGYRVVLVVAGASEVLCVIVTFPFLLRLRRVGKIE